MSSTHQFKFSRLIVAVVFGVFAFLAAKDSVAQPSNYCRAYCPAGYHSCWCYSHSAWITNVKLTHDATGDVKLERSSGQESGCRYYDESQIGKMNPGETYTLSVTWRDRYCRSYLRAYLDWNIDGDFYDSNIFNNPVVNESLGRFYHSASSVSNCSFLDEYSTANGNEIKVPQDITDNDPNFSLTEGKTRLRIMVCYNYDSAPCCLGRCSYDTRSRSYMNWGYGEYEDYIVQFEGGIKDLFPTNGDILFAGEDYNDEWRDHDGDGTDSFFQKPGYILTGNQQAGTLCTYYMTGPKPSNEVVYTGLAVYPSESNEIDVGNQGETYSLEHAEGNYAYPKDPYGDGTFNADRGGEYRVYAKQVGKPRVILKKFTVSWNNDMAVTEVTSPRTNVEPQYFKYVRGQSIKVSGVYQNTGLYNVDEFYGLARIWDPDGELVYRDSSYYSAPPREVLKGGLEDFNDFVRIDFRTCRFTRTGVYTLQLCANLMSTNDPNYTGDEDGYNDCLSREDDDEYTFCVAHEIQLQTDEIIRPCIDSVVLANRPIIPWVIFRNVGIGDASDVPARMVVKDENGTIVYDCEVLVQDVPAGKYNTKHKFFDPMVIKEPGTYSVCAWITSEEDPVPEDDTLCATFFVDDGLRGVYTVGKLYEGRNRNFPSIDSVMNDLYYRGITGTCVFELTDAAYTQESNDELGGPAWDFRSMIIGLGYDSENDETNEIIWRPHRNRANTRGGVTINLNSMDGQGVTFGQAVFPTNYYAVMVEFPTVPNANTPGYITLDGGKQKAFRFVLNSQTDVFGAAIYLDRGAENITIRNCLIENGTPALKTRDWVPLVMFDPTMGFSFEGNTTGAGAGEDGYSAGIALRSTLLRFEEADFLRLDTIPNRNNTIDNNEISGFGYGILSLGLGALYLTDDAIYSSYYNKNNDYTNNIISDVYRAGIFLGFEEGSNVSHNRVYDVAGADDASGIILGGNARGDLDGYNVMEVTLDGNEISGVSASRLCDGIRVDQNRITFQDPAGGIVYFPDRDEGLTICNNLIWGLDPGVDAYSGGVNMFTRRDETQADVWDIVATPFENDYFMRGDRIVNNTILISDNSVDNRGGLAAIAVQQAFETKVYNNAIMFEDGGFSEDSPVAAAIFYQGPRSDKGGIISDRNAYCLAEGSNATIYRFIQTNDESAVLDDYGRDGFQTLNQWQMWTGQDENSVAAPYDEVKDDWAYFGNAPHTMRINDVPTPPVGSVFNNRGEIVEGISVDVDGNARGAAGQRYDIGACEFNGKMYISDVEMLNIPTPGAYKAGSGQFDDAEYIMTVQPCEISASLRNNGSLQQSDINVYVKVYQEDVDGTYPEDVYTEGVVKATVSSTESIEVSFNLDDGADPDFNPSTYAELEANGLFYDVPYRFTTMMNNVTPKYKIVVSVESDQHNDNNILEKEVRFYLRRSTLRILVSSENSIRDIYAWSDDAPGAPLADEIAGRLNYDSLLFGIRGLGWTDDLKEITGDDDEVIEYVADLDVFERTGWEPRSVNYTLYRSMFWTDGDEKGMDRYQRLDAQAFLDEGDDKEKRNLIIGSQELVRSLSEVGGIQTYDLEFVGSVLRAENIYPYNPLGYGVDNNGNKVVGDAVGKLLVEDVSSTSYVDYEYRDSDGLINVMNDRPPYCGLMAATPTGEGWARPAYHYVNYTGLDSVMGVATTGLTRNVIMLGVDWRHWGDIDRVLRSVIDFVEKNGGQVIPIELAGFNATPVGKRVDLSWATVSEQNSSRFEVERADISPAGRDAFRKIDEVEAAGASSSLKEYGPLSDYNVDYGQSYVYRLKMIDNDGQYKYSDEKIAVIGDGALSVSEVRPNPANEEAVFDLTLDKAREISIIIYDVNGAAVATVFEGTRHAGVEEIKVDVKDLASGSYTLALRSGDVVITRTIRVLK